VGGPESEAALFEDSILVWDIHEMQQKQRLDVLDGVSALKGLLYARRS